MKPKKWYGTWPAQCDLCARPLETFPTFYDARLADDPRWGLFCADCWQRYGAGLGTGLGQEYDSLSREKLRG